MRLQERQGISTVNRTLLGGTELEEDVPDLAREQRSCARQTDRDTRSAGPQQNLVRRCCEQISEGRNDQLQVVLVGHEARLRAQRFLVIIRE